MVWLEQLLSAVAGALGIRVSSSRRGRGCVCSLVGLASSTEVYEPLKGVHPSKNEQIC